MEQHHSTRAFERQDDPPQRLARSTCRVCGCTDNDCSGCIERTGGPCYWIGVDLCSACGTFQQRVRPWMLECFGPEISADRAERNHRFLEEALELVQANGCTQAEAHQLVDYVFGRPQGDINQEVGGVMVTLAALCLANGEDMHAAGEKELARVWTKIAQIRAKQAAKPKHSPLPEAAASHEPGGSDAE